MGERNRNLYLHRVVCARYQVPLTRVYRKLAIGVGIERQSSKIVFICSRRSGKSLSAAAVVAVWQERMQNPVFSTTQIIIKRTGAFCGISPLGCVMTFFLIYFILTIYNIMVTGKFQ